MPETDIVLVSDLHLGVRAAPSEKARAFSAAIEWASSEGATDLVLLGDTFDLDIVATDGPSASKAVDRMVHIGASNRWLREALEAFSGGGGTVRLVPGNHDAILRVFTEGAGSYAMAQILPGVSIEPWSVHISGFLYAEHGHQLHDLQAYACWLSPDHDPAPLPVGALLDQRRAGRVSATACIRGVVRHMAWRGSSSAARLYASYSGGPLVAFAEASGIPPVVVQAADLWARSTRTKMMLGLLGRRLRPADRTLPRSTYLLGAAQELGMAAQVGGTALPFVVFGHSHEPTIRDLGSTTYLNTGWWPADGGHLVRIGREGSTAFAHLLRSAPGRRPSVQDSRSCEV